MAQTFVYVGLFLTVTVPIYCESQNRFFFLIAATFRMRTSFNAIAVKYCDVMVLLSLSFMFVSRITLQFSAVH